MHAVPVGGAPGIGKTSVAREWLALAASGSELAQWVDVDDLWRHQPWRVDDATRSMLRANLSAVVNNAAACGVALLLTTWVFQDAEKQELIRGLLPANSTSTTVQLRLTEQTWRARFTSDPTRPEIDTFFQERYSAAQATSADHIIDTDGLDPRAVAHRLAVALGLPAT